jgi:signal transduction histidine kinase
VPRETLDELRNEVAELRASRERLVLTADAERRAIERELHAGVQQHLVALAVNLQRAETLANSDPAAMQALLEELGRDVQEALDAAAQIAHRLYPPLLDAGGLGAALRSAAASAGIPARIEVGAGASFIPEVAGALYFCCLELLGNAVVGERLTVTVAEEKAAVAFQVGPVRSDAELDRVRDRVEALGGTLTLQSELGRDVRVSGSLPLRR